MVIKEASKADISILLDILLKSFAGVAERFNLTVENCPKNLAFCTKQRIEDDFARGLQYYMLEDDGQTCGCVALEKASDEVFYLERLAVLPEHRRRGVAQALINAAVEGMRHYKAKLCYLEVRVTNAVGTPILSPLTQTTQLQQSKQKLCPTCGKKLTFIQQNNRLYCYQCRKYD